MNGNILIVCTILFLTSLPVNLAQFWLLGQGQYNKIDETQGEEEEPSDEGSDLVCPEGQFVIGYSRDGPGQMKVICGSPTTPLVDSECATREISLNCDLEMPDGCTEPDSYMKGLEVIKTGTGADVIFPICCTAANFRLGYEGACQRQFVNARLRPGEHTAEEGFVVTKFTCHNVVEYLREAEGKRILDQVFFTHDCPYTVDVLAVDYEEEDVLQKRVMSRRVIKRKWRRRQ